MPEFRMRPIAKNDLGRFLKLVGSIGSSLTSLPYDEGRLKEKIDESIHAFDPNLKAPKKENYLFVMESLKSGELVGVSGIKSKAGYDIRFSAFDLKKEKHLFEEDGEACEVEYLEFKKDRGDASEVCSLYLKPEARKDGLGALLALSRYLFIAQNRERFHEEVIAEMRGYKREDGTSPFFDAVGQCFYRNDFEEVDLRRGRGEYDYIFAFLPKLPIYVPLLPKDAQDAIGRPHKNTESAVKLLEREGFSKMSEVDILDAGPTYGAQTGSIRAVKETKTGVLKRIEKGMNEKERKTIVASGGVDFRACFGLVEEIAQGEVAVEESVASALELKVGEPIAYLKI